MSEDKTRIIRRPLENLAGPTPPSPRDDDETRLEGERSESPSSLPTRYLNPADAPAVAGSSSADLGKTVLMGRSSRGASSFDPLKPATKDPMSDPVVGWFVILKGPGQGAFVPLGYGWNAIGRDATQRVSLNFGDEEITRVNHAKLLYDPRSRKFTITLGDGTNPTYVRCEALLAPTALNAGDILQMGSTYLQFVPFCGPEFDWQSEAE